MSKFSEPIGTKSVPATNPLKQNGVSNGTLANSKELPELKLNGFVGFDSLPYQLVRKCHSNG